MKIPVSVYLGHMISGWLGRLVTKAACPSFKLKGLPGWRKLSSLLMLFLSSLLSIPLFLKLQEEGIYQLHLIPSNSSIQDGR